MKTKNKKIKIPKSFQGILWSRNVKKLDLEKDKEYIIHQILMYGNLSQIRWLFKVYNFNTIREVFIKNPRPIYTSPIFKFIKNFVLDLKKYKLNKKYYVKNILGSSIRPPKKRT
jgi:hypothetical protein